MRGLYAIFEGADGTGKTSTMDLVAKKIRNMGITQALKKFGHSVPKINLTHHPGSTPLGRHLRTLVKNPAVIDQDIEIDPLSRQMLYMVDKINFTNILLNPALDKNEWVFADRSNLISAIAYGSVEGVPIDEIQRLHALIQHRKADRLYIFQCPVEVAMERIRASSSRYGKVDYFDDKPAEFFERVMSVYDNMITGPQEIIMAVTRSVALENVKYIDSSGSQQSVVDEIVEDLSDLIMGRVAASEE